MNSSTNRRTKSGWKILAFLASLISILLLVYSAGNAPAQESLSASEKRGKQIYVQGTSPSRKEILAYLSEASMEVPGNTVACANCHALDGQGKPEGGISPSNITNEALTKPYGVTHSDGRKHPPYTDRGLELAITRGVDPAGNKLLSVMPRYVMTKEDLADLVAYLKRVGKDRDPGISESKIVIGTAVPANGPLAEMGQAIKAMTTAFFDEINNQGGIYNRRIEVKFAETGETAAATHANFESLIKDGQVFAITGAFVAGAEKEIIPLMAQQEVPLIGPVTLYPQTDLPLNRQVFYLLAGIDDQARAMVSFVANRPELKQQRIAVVFPGVENQKRVVSAIKDRSKKDGLPEPQIYEYAAGAFNAAEAISQVRRTGSEAIFFFGNNTDSMSFMNEAGKLGWFPTIFLPSGSAGKEVFDAPAGFNGKLFFSLPTSPADQSAEGLREFRTLSEKYKLPARHVAVQVSTYSAAKILVEAMKRVGRDLSRERLIQVLDGLYEYQTGLTPAITYGPNRRIGALGAYVVTVDLKDKKFSPVGGWIGLN